MLRLVRRIKGDDRIILITDAGVDDGPMDLVVVDYKLNVQNVFLKGVLQ